MATLRRTFFVDAPLQRAWAAFRDVYECDKVLAAGFVIECKREDGARVVTFANGVVARELIVSVDDEARRVVYASVGGRLTHHNASAQVFADGPERSRVEWVVDLLPDAMAPAIESMMDVGIQAMQRTIR